jgi:hypothetical protein
MANEVTKKDIEVINKRMDALSRDLEATRKWTEGELKKLTEMIRAVERRATDEIDKTNNAVNDHVKRGWGIQ